MIDTGFGEDELGIDWDNLWENLPHDPGFDFVDQPNSGCSLSIDDIEKYLLDDQCESVEKEDQIVIEDGFFPDVLLDLSPRSSPSPVFTGTNREEKDEDKQVEIRVDDGVQISEKNDSIDGADDDGNDPDSKKRKRQMRNRDAAVRSRERKKVYVKDLEMKSKFYEGECKRLGILLQSCVAENQALRFALHNTKALDVSSMTKQESAVLLLESLLLGSLLGFVGIILCLFLLIRQPTSLLGKIERRVAPRKAGNDKALFVTSMMGKKYKGSRPKMKSSLASLGTRVLLSTPKIYA